VAYLLDVSFGIGLVFVVPSISRCGCEGLVYASLGTKLGETFRV